MTYRLYFTDEAKKDLAGLKQNEPAAFKKAKALLTELQQHTRTGTEGGEGFKPSASIAF
jgi:mRNA-degrading endonuclease RelE of RelBE toxin-antitoxin system